VFLPAISQPYALGLVQGLLGLCFAICFPDSMIHHLRVGLGYCVTGQRRRRRETDEAGIGLQIFAADTSVQSVLTICFTHAR